MACYLSHDGAFDTRVSGGLSLGFGTRTPARERASWPLKALSRKPSGALRIHDTLANDYECEHLGDAGRADILNPTVPLEDEF